MGGTSGHRPAHGFSRAGDITHHGLVGDVKTGDLLTAVIAANRIGVDLPAGVSDELRTGRGQFPQIGADGVEQSADGVLVGLDLQRTEFRPDECGTFAGLGHLGALVDLGTQLAQLANESLRPTAAGMHHDQHCSGR